MGAQIINISFYFSIQVSYCELLVKFVEYFLCTYTKTLLLYVLTMQFLGQ